MNRIERALHDALEDYPVLRTGIRDLYQRVLACVPSRNRFHGTLNVRPGFFYGFHTTCPWSPCNQLLLTHRCIESALRPPRPGDTVEVGYLGGVDFNSYTPVATTRCWNWQQGSMLQWVGQGGRLAYNDVVDGRIRARITDVTGSNTRILDRPLAAVSPSGGIAVSYTFERFRNGMPGYDYASASDNAIGDDRPEGDGLFIIDTNSGATHLLFSIAELARLHPARSFEGAYHFVSHCLFAPGGGRFAFFHRWRIRGGAVKTRLISCELDGSGLHIFPTGDVVSHYAWVGDSHILSFCDVRGRSRGYYLLRDGCAEIAPVGARFFKSDGHPQIAPDGRRMITDSYPDRHRNQHLLMYDLDRSTGFELARLRIPFRFRNQVRCDFHPRWDRAGRIISFDSAHTGVRAHCTIRVGDGALDS